ncbi:MULTISPECIES: DUF2752 domain-containing protein [Actinomyces]|uniref:DUF2752 domain-containing protein n=1 Tax=Actinomyces respiraculi TaxID=2744574 RepID=A0A7T0LJ18_9ACTO|nr:MULTISPECIES: DUF2752 domain-containing protein [Actinomyces]QPL04500.1 DUF2752 domain-containing protein [Actinomyces respiraculi]
MTSSCSRAEPDARAEGRRRVLTGTAVAVSFLPGAAIVAAGLLRAPGTGVDLCPVHRLTGFWCPLCGGTRATRALLHGDLLTAVGYNPVAPVVLALAAAVAVRWVLSRRAGRERPILTGREMVALFCLAGAFGVARNLPGMWVYLGPLLGPAG